MRVKQSNQKILIVEDDLGLSTLLKRSLSREGYQCYTADSGEEAFKIINENLPDLVLLDYKLSDMTAIDFLNKYNISDLEIIIMTGFGNEKLAVELMKLGAHDYIVKEEGFTKILPSIIEKTFFEIDLKRKLIQSERKLKESEEKHRTLFNNTAIGIYRTSIDGRILMANNAIVKMLQFKNLDELKKINLNDKKYSEMFDRQSFIAKFDDCDEITGYEYPWIREDDSLAVFRESSRVTRNSKGEILYFDGTLEDITDKVSAELSLRKSEERLQLILQATNDGIWDWNIKDDMTYYSDRFANMLNVDLRKLPSDFKKIVKFIHEKDKERFLKEINKHIEGKTPLFNLEFRVLVNEEEKYIWVNGKAKVTERESNGNAVRMVGVFSNISERKKAEENLNLYKKHLEEEVSKRTQKLIELNNELKSQIEKQKRYETKIINHLNLLRILIETAPSPIFIKDIDKRFIDCNEAFEKFFEINKEDLIGKTDVDIFPEEEIDKYKISDRQVFNSENKVEFETFFETKSGVKKELLVSKAAFRDSDNKFAGIIGIIADITVQKKMQRQIHEAFQHEKEVKELKTKFIATASHEFRTPLTTIISSIDLLDIFNQKGNRDKYLAHINKIKKAAGKLSDLVDEVLMVNKAEQKTIVYEKSETNISELLNDIIEDVKFQSDIEKDISIKQSGSTENIFIEKKLLQLILSNLLSNAMKYSSRKINIEIYSKSEMLEIKVKNDGKPIPEKDKENLFEPFYRAENSEELQGTGLGLSIVKNAVDTLKGKISFTSDNKNGTVFYISLPHERIVYEENPGN